MQNPFTGLRFNMKNLFLSVVIMLLVAACGVNGGKVPSSISPSSNSCDGNLVADACWYLGNNGESCDDVCADHGGYNQATLTFAGSEGNVNNCNQVADEISMGGSTVTNSTSCYYGYGCLYDLYSSARIRCTDVSTDASAAIVGVQRACACNE